MLKIKECDFNQTFNANWEKKFFHLPTKSLKNDFLLKNGELQKMSYWERNIAEIKLRWVFNFANMRFSIKPLWNMEEVYILN